MDTFDNLNVNFDIPSDVLDEIQQNIQNIIEGFDIPEDNKYDVIKKINFMYSQTKHMSITDPLTGLFNRRHFESNLDREYSRAKRYKNELSFAIIDIDFFKKINDTYGHSCGDYVLKEVAYIISNTFRISDMVFRYGGEEFVVILTETPLENSIIPLERLRKAVEASKFVFNKQEIKVTVSIGASSINEDVANAWEMFDLADKALYFAKENGRNQVKLSS
ncbi:MAG: GGDEF domain-containing protein [Candidatus Gastranaerophilaceae bacterium]